MRMGTLVIGVIIILGPVTGSLFCPIGLLTDTVPLPMTHIYHIFIYALLSVRQVPFIVTV